MNKRLWFFAVIILSFLISSCSNDTDAGKETKWDCTVTCAEKSKEESYIITYSEEEVVSSTGTLSVQSRNDFDIIVHLLTDSESERSIEVPAGGVSCLYQIEKDVIYTAGCQADVEDCI